MNKPLNALRPVGAALGMGIVLMAMAGGQARAQNALGDGRKLDASLEKGSRGINRPAVRDFAAEVRFRNAIVTGNAPGGLSFRGDAGYTAGSEFRDRLGSNDLFSFRRDSLYSGLAGLGIRGTDALQYQFGMTTGAAGLSQWSDILTPKRFGGAALGTLKRTTDAMGQPAITRSSVSQQGAGNMAELRSTSSYVTNRGLSPTLLGVQDDPDGSSYGLIASPLTGVRFVTITNPLSDGDEDSIGSTAANYVPPAAVRGAARVEPLTTETSYQKILERFNKSGLESATDSPESSDAPVIPQWQQNLLDLQKYLLDKEDKKEKEAKPNDTQNPANPAIKDDSQSEDGVDIGAKVGSVVASYDPRTLELLRKSGGTIESLTASDIAVQGAFQRHIDRGQSLLAKGSHFDAEAHFARALAIRPQEPMAAIGRVNAQIGAGLVRSAAMNLRQVLLTNPELITTRYGSKLMPQPKRLDQVIVLLDERIDNKLVDASEAGMLLAYLGYQRHDQDVIRRGLKAWDQSGKDRLAELASKVWLDE